MLCTRRAVGISARAGQLKDTSRNLLRHGDFALNLMSQETMEKMNITAIEFGPDVNELEAASLTDNVEMPRLTLEQFTKGEQ